MTTQPAPTPHISDAAADVLPTGWHRLLALSGVVFALLFLVGWFTTGGVTPHYDAPDQDWTNWASDNQWNGRISAFLMLLSGFVFLYFVGAIRSVLGRAESPVRGSAQIARAAFGGGVIGMAGMAMASVTLATASSDGADVDPVVSKAVATAAGGPFLLAAMGFAAFLMAAGVLTLRTGAFHAGPESWLYLGRSVSSSRSSPSSTGRLTGAHSAMRSSRPSCRSSFGQWQRASRGTAQWELGVVGAFPPDLKAS